LCGDQVQARVVDSSRGAPPTSPEGDLPNRIDFTGPKGWPLYEKAFIEYATRRREGFFTNGCKGKFWEEAAQDLSKTAIFKKSKGEIEGKLHLARFKLLVAEAERLYGVKGTERRRWRRARTPRTAGTSTDSTCARMQSEESLGASVTLQPRAEARRTNRS
jgi:hypothetical protein